MADTKISALPASTTPLAGTEVLPIVQSGVTRQVSVANLTAGRAISATQLTLTTGSLIVASGQGVDFSATPGTGTSELFDDYEEGTWTMTLSPETSGSIALFSGFNEGTYTKVGRLVTVTGYAYIQTTSSPVGNIRVQGLPFTIANTTSARGAASVAATGLAAGATTSITGRSFPNETQFYLSKYAAGSFASLAPDIQNFAEIWFTFSYITAS